MKTEIDFKTNYWLAFHYMAGIIVTREQLKMPPLPAKELYQKVYDEYGVKPIDSVTEQLGLKIKEQFEA